MKGPVFSCANPVKIYMRSPCMLPQDIRISNAHLQISVKGYITTVLDFCIVRAKVVAGCIQSIICAHCHRILR